MAELAGSAGTVHVACCFDQQMELPFLILASSLKRHLKGDRRVVLHALHSDPIAHDQAYFVELNSATFELRLRQIENRFRGVATGPSRVTAATFLRFLLPAVLKDIDRVVYLDCDLVVLKDITTLYDADLSDFPLAACLDFWLTGAPPFAPPIVGWGVGDWHKFLSEVVKLTDCKAYFNAGVLVMDLKRFRDTGLIDAAEEFLEQTNYKTVFVDQDALNHVINGAFVRLDLRWNVFGNRSETDLNNADCEIATSAALSHAEPWIIHYAGPNKPWSCEGRRITFWNRWFWQEAAESAVLPLLVRAYLETCDRRGLTKLQSAGVLLSSGKPRLCKRDVLAHAEKYRSFTKAAQASESIARDLDRPIERTDAATALVSVDVLSHRGGIRDGETLTFDLKVADGHLVFGPYLWYPAGNYEATFSLAATRVAPEPTNKLVIDIVDNADRCLAQRELSPIPSATERTLQFVVDRSELLLAFRVFATGFSGGELRFGGVTLRSHGPH
ncbi:MAG TPA: glycosyltransferase family 8 protein [Xanthobacteraceae bacterium]|jgi:lipopolysaccharide biosynthesis glycosyltransferase